ncbi:hypothetical protein, partial [Escherichia coli]|uniref:hypothetical protein n=1 Tax=Escherichia coli TaxID=562 RepID=UPI00374DE398
KLFRSCNTMILKMFWQDKWSFWGCKVELLGVKGGAFGGERWSFWGCNPQKKGVAKKKLPPI